MGRKATPFEKYGNWSHGRGHRLEPKCPDTVLAPRVLKPPDERNIELILFYAAFHHHVDEVRLRESAKTLTIINFTGKLIPFFFGCLLPKGLRKPFPSSAGTRAILKLEHV